MPLLFHSRAVRRSWRQLRHELGLQRAHRAAVRRARAYRGRVDLLLNLGCGENLKPGWVNVDALAPGALPLDLREALPFDDHSATTIYCEHFLEHLEYPKEVGRFLRECRRVLVPGGRLSLGVPDTEWPVRSYAADEEAYFRLAREKFHPKWCDTKMHNLNFHFRQGSEHKYAYDYETLAAVLAKQGFTSVRRREFDPLLDTLARAVGTLYVEATTAEAGVLR